jgi:glutamate-1-semialdehyde 2,1-aminomutase
VSASGWHGIDGVAGDLYTFGKVMSGGLPAAAFGGSVEHMAHLAPAGPVYQAGTLSGNPVAMTAGIWALERLTPRLYKELARRGSMLAAGLADAARAAKVPLQVNAFGSLVTPFFGAAPVRDYASALNANTSAYATFFRGMLTRGVYPPPSQFEAWFLSAAHSDRDVQKTIAAARGAMRDVAKAI